MKIIDTDGGDPYFSKDEITNFIHNSIPELEVAFQVLKIEIEAGWVYITVKNNEKEFSINYSDLMVDTSDVIKFFAQITNLKEDIACILNYEGSWPLLFAQPLGDNLRFIFAHDYKLFMNDDVGEYNLSDYTIECDIVINKKYFLEEFYKALFIYVNNNSHNEVKKSSIPYNPELGQKYLNIIKRYLNRI